MNRILFYQTARLKNFTKKNFDVIKELCIFVNNN